MEMKYYQFWKIRKNTPKYPLTEDEAKKYHEEQQPYKVVVLEEGKMKYVVNVNFNIFYCHVYYLNDNQVRVRMDAYMEHGEGLFLAQTSIWENEHSIEHDDFLYDPDGTYTKIHYDDKGYDVDHMNGNCDVSTHFREMIRFGYYDPILPKRISE